MLKIIQCILLFTFAFLCGYKTARAQIVLTEIRTKTKGRDLPPYPYIEIYNKGSASLTLTGYQLQVDSAYYVFPNRRLAPKQFMLLVPEGTAAEFRHFGNVVSLVGWRSLSDRGAVLQLLDQAGTMVDMVAYSDRWYEGENESKAPSLERINPGYNCNIQPNWKESSAPLGGTPGFRNSVWNESYVPPLLPKVQIQDPLTLWLTVGLPLHLAEPLSVTSFSFVDDQNVVKEVMQDGEGVRLKVAQPLEDDLIYQLRITALYFCGISYQADLVVLRSSDMVEKDIVINEVLFNPKDNGAAFVEIYNRSEKPIDLSSCLLGGYPISLERHVLLSQEFRVLTTSFEKVARYYPASVQDVFIEMVRLPRMANAGGEVVLRTAGSTIDSLVYTPGMHQPFLRNTKGISLERRGYNLETNAPGSFTSAAVLAGGATPGYENSSFVEKKEEKNNLFLRSQTMSPNGDGIEDFLTIYYDFSVAAPMLSVTIYDDKGRIVKRLIRNKSAGQQGEIQWNGKDDNGQDVKGGFYICYAELYGSLGHFQSFKLSFVLVRT